ncbi:MAG: DUF2804 domain-containing protein [Polyangiales bacterium]
MTNGNPELRDEVDLCLPDGRLNPAARGHSRRQLHRTNLRGFGRTKRWEYWGIITPTHVIGLTLADLDVLSLQEVFLLDRATGRERSIPFAAPMGLGVRLPDGLPPFEATGHGPYSSFRFTGEHARPGRPAGTRLHVRVPRVSLNAFVESAGDALGVVVPFGEGLFQYTLKAPACPVSGVIWVDGVSYAIPAGESWAVLDRGRGRWPHAIVWNWAVGSGVVEGKRTGLQLGAKWTAGTGATENALFVDGVMHYLPDEVDFTYDTVNWDRPWRAQGERLDVTLTPFHVRHAGVDLGPLGSEVHQAFGHWRGWVSDTHGVRHSVDGLVGWAEQADNRW